MLRLLLLSLTDPEAAGNGETDNQPTVYTHDEFLELSLAELEELTGVVRPKNSTVEEIDNYRDKAWKSYRQDVTNLEEWGTARQGDDPDEMDRVNGNGNGAQAAEELATDMLEEADGEGRAAERDLHGMGDRLHDNYDDDYIEDKRLEDDNYER